MATDVATDETRSECAAKGGNHTRAVRLSSADVPIAVNFDVLQISDTAHPDGGNQAAVIAGVPSREGRAAAKRPGPHLVL